MITVLTRPGHVPDSGIVIADARQLEELLKERRIERGWTMTQVAAVARLSKHAVSDFESPRSKAKLITATKYAAALDVRVTVRVPAGSPTAVKALRGPAPAGVHPVMALLVRRRRSLGRTQDWLSQQIHRSPESISRWENGTQMSLLEDAIWYALAVQARLVLRPAEAAAVAR